METLTVFLCGALIAISVVALYLYFLAGVYFLRRRREVPISSPRKRFAIIVPAHNEEAVIGESVRSAFAADYPKSVFDVYVIADNCLDRTREIAEESGARCLVRNEPLRHGKGYALRHAFDLLSDEGYDAFVVIDADTLVSPNLLSAFNNRLCVGQHVIQCRNIFRNADSTPMSYLLHVGKCIENSLLWEAKSRLGQSVVLQGNGMCISSKVLKSHPWEAFSVTEDVEYSFSLIKAGVKIYYAHETEVLSLPAALREQTSKQRLRWASGSSRLFRKHFFGMIFHSFRTRRIAPLDTAFSIILNSKLALMTISTLTLATSLLLFLVQGRRASEVMFVWSGCVFILILSYFAIGVAISKFTPRRARLLLFSPVSLLYLSLISILGVLGLKQKTWVRTPRDTTNSRILL